MDVFGLGVLIVGESGIGKSECALDLIDRGHRLVADDVVEIRRIGDTPDRRLARPTRYHMELRGLGVINIKDLYGVSSIRMSQRVELVVSLERWEAGREYDRLGLQDEKFLILGLEMPLIRMPVAPGRNIAILVEVAARNQLLKERGYDAARRFAERVDEMIEAEPDAPPRRRLARGPPRPRTRAAGRRGDEEDRAAADAPLRGAPARRSAAAEPRILIITGLCGSGKTHVARALEDIGWFCVDNLPTALIPRFADLIRDSEELHRSALVVDMRERDFLKQFPHVFRQLRAKGFAVSLLFLEAEEKVLQRRFSETRRPHPLAINQPAIEGIREEREALRPIRKMADLILDTSDYTVHQLRDYIREHYDVRAEQSPLVLSVMSFGYKYGVPSEADLVFDARFLPNPNFVPSLKALTGNHPPVVRYMKRQPDTARFIKKLDDFLSYVIPRYIKEGKSYLTIGIGCTGGRHRSVMIANAVAERLAGAGLSVRVRHRDLRQDDG